MKGSGPWSNSKPKVVTGNPMGSPYLAAMGSTSGGLSSRPSYPAAPPAVSEAVASEVVDVGADDVVDTSPVLQTPVVTDDVHLPITTVNVVRRHLASRLYGTTEKYNPGKVRV